MNRKVVVVLSRGSTETKPKVPLFVLKELQFNFKRRNQRGQEELNKAGAKRH